MRFTVAILVLAFVPCLLLDAQQNQQLRIDLQVPRAGFMGFSSANSSVEFVGSNADSRQVNVRVRRSDAGGVHIVQLLARSNSAYRILVGTSAAGAERVRIGNIVVSPNAGGARLTQGATNARTLSASLSATPDEVRILEGPRISNGGNNGTPDNAVLISIPLEFPQDALDADLSFRMELLPD
jgi:hypothetical protein